MWFACGQEQMIDESSLIAQEAARQGVSVQWTEYVEMPHLFAFRFPGFPQSSHVFKSWTDFIKACVSRNVIKSRAVKVPVTDLREEELRLDQLLSISQDTLRTLMRQKQLERKAYTGKKVIKSIL